MCREQAKHGALEEAVVDASWDSYFQKLFREEYCLVFVLSNFFCRVMEQLVLFITGNVLWFIKICRINTNAKAAMSS